MPSLFETLTKSRPLLRDFVVRDLRSRYVGSSMGFFWSVIFPLINLLTFMFVFRIILATRWGDEQGPLEVSFVMLAGIIVWTGFSEAIARSTGSIIANANLVEKVVFPAAVLPAYITLSALANMCFGLPIILGGALFFGHLSKPGVLVEFFGQAAAEGVWEGYELSDDVPRWPAARIALDRAWREPTTVRLEWGGTAIRGEDYLAPHDFVTVPAGVARFHLPVIPLRDSVVEGDETVEVRIVELNGAAVDRAPSTFVLHDSMLPPEEVARELDRTTEPYGSLDPNVHHPLSLGLPLVMLPVLVLLLAVATTGIGAFFAAFNLYWRDTMHLIGVGLTAWMFATPIFYPAHLIPDAYRIILVVNPMHWFIDMFRDVTLFARWPDPVNLALFTAFAAIVFVLGGRFFMKHQPKFPDLL